MAKAVEITFAIGAALTGGFSGAFGKAGQALSQLQKQASSMEKQSGQITQFQKMQGTVARTATRLNEAKARAQKLGEQLKTTANPTQAMQKQFAQANAEVSRLQGKFNDQCKSLNALNSEMKAAGINTSKLKEEQARLAEHSQKVTQAQERLKNSQAALKATQGKLSWNNMKGDLMASAALGFSLAKPINEASDFEHAMARINAVAFSGGNKSAAQREQDAESLKQLTAQARQLGRDTQFTAVQAANSQENLARAGFKTNEIIAAMPGLLSMAAAEGMDLANAADIAASTLRGFNMSADQMNHVADVLAQTSAASNTSIAGLGESMKYVAPVASGLAISVEEVSAMLGVMGNAGIKGSEGGTALRGALLRLAQEPKAVSNALADLGIRAKTSTGKLRELPDLMTELSKKMHGWGEGKQMQYLSNIFGVRAASGMLAVMRGVADGSLKELEYLAKESSGVVAAMMAEVNKGLEKPIVTLEEMRAGMKTSEKQAGKLGISYNELAAYLSVLAQQGIKGEKADKGLTAAFTQLQKQPKQVQKAFQKYKINALTEGGFVKDFPDLLKEADKALKGMDNAKQLKAIESMFGKGTGESIQKLMQGMTDGALDTFKKAGEKATGVSKEMADKVLNTLWGQKELAKSAISDLLITIGDVLLPVTKESVTAFTNITASIGKFAHENPRVTKTVVGAFAAIASYKVGVTALGIAWNLAKLPFLHARVALDWLNAKLLMSGHTSLWAAAKTKILTVAQKAWGAVMKIGRGLLDVGKLALYYGKQILITTATKAWTAAQWLWNAALNANPIGLLITAIAAAIAIGYAMYKNWDTIKKWWNSWTIKDVFACLKDYASKAWKFVKDKWLEFWDWWGSVLLGDWWEPIKKFAVDAYNYVKGKWEEFKTWWNSWSIIDVFIPVKEYAETAKNYVLEKWQALSDWWDSWSLSDIFAPVKDYAVGAYNWVMDKWQSFKKWWDSWSLSDIFANIKLPEFKLPDISWDTLKNGFNSAIGVITSGWEKFKGIFTIESLSGIWDGLVSGFNTACDLIGKAWDKTLGLLKSGWDKLVGFADWATFGVFGLTEDSEADTQKQLQDITMLNKMSEGFNQRVAEMTAAWQPFKASLGEGFEQIYTLMQGVADKIRGVTIPAVNELVSSLSRVASEIQAIVQAGELSVEVKAPTGGGATGNQPVSRMAGGRNKVGRRALGGFIDRPELSLIGEAGREVVVPLENRARGIPLWKAAGEELGFSFGNSQTTNNNRNVTMSPNINITVNGGDQNTEARFRQIIEDVLADLQDREGRLSFA